MGVEANDTALIVVKNQQGPAIGNGGQRTQGAPVAVARLYERQASACGIDLPRRDALCASTGPLAGTCGVENVTLGVKRECVSIVKFICMGTR
jgi:hypothetical protein